MFWCSHLFTTLRSSSLLLLSTLKIALKNDSVGGARPKAKRKQIKVSKTFSSDCTSRMRIAINSFVLKFEFEVIKSNK